MGDAEDYDAVVLAVDHHADVALLTVLDQVGAQGLGPGPGGGPGLRVWGDGSGLQVFRVDALPKGGTPLPRTGLQRTQRRLQCCF